MVTTQFEQGNYNEWYNSVIFLMPKINDLYSLNGEFVNLE